ncbi:MAG TPA: hypothetical protein VFE20_05110 [Thermoleophilia bacterium]|nr:hypothetical protein [Thermoleophilia bacterium]
MEANHGHLVTVNLTSNQARELFRLVDTLPEYLAPEERVPLRAIMLGAVKLGSASAAPCKCGEVLE